MGITVKNTVRSDGVKANVTLYLPEELLDRCRQAAAQDGRSLSNYLTRLLEDTHPRLGVVHRLGRKER